MPPAADRSTLPAIDSDRLLGDLRRLREFGACGPGVVRTAFSEIDLEARRWLAQRMTEAGLATRIDGAGNVIGRSPGPGRAVLMGSHSDTQPRGGWLDGAMGVIYALEIARALRECDATRALPLDVASWMDEEGTYCGCLGSKCFTGEVLLDDVKDLSDVEGRTLAEAVAAAGLAGESIARLEPERHAAYLEAHIEQGGVLEAEGRRIGVVTDIVGFRTYDIEFRGQQNHAGTTPMRLRRDAGDALIALAAEIRTAFRPLLGPRTVFTIGRVVFHPGSHSTIPGHAEMSLQFRDPEVGQLERMEAKTHELVAAANERGPVEVSLRLASEALDPAAMDRGMQEHIARAAEAHVPGGWMRMPSGAIHDATVISRCIPSAMLFVPSIGGVSHDFAEDTPEDDIVLGCQVLASATAEILLELNSG